MIQKYYRNLMAIFCTKSKSKSGEYICAEKKGDAEEKTLAKYDVENEHRDVDFAAENELLRLEVQHLKDDAEEHMPIVSVSATVIDKLEAESRADDLANENEELMNENERLKILVKTMDRFEAEQKAANLAAENEALRIEIRSLKEAKGENPVVYEINPMAIYNFENEQKAAYLAAENDALKAQMQRHISTHTMFYCEEDSDNKVGDYTELPVPYSRTTFCQKQHPVCNSYNDMLREDMKSIYDEEDEDMPRLPFPCWEIINS
eukprot:Tbor_TRINITY_DN5424_c4_g2::TRINITY_DN5424_c4_g2_i1::g.24537::m.24537